VTDDVSGGRCPSDAPYLSTKVGSGSRCVNGLVRGADPPPSFWLPHAFAIVAEAQVEQEDCRDPGNAACSSVARPSSCGRSGNICRTAALPASRLVLACFSLRAIDSRSTNRRPRSSMKRCTSLRSAGQPLDLIDHDRRGPRKRPQPVGKERRIAQVRLIEPFVQEIDSSGHGQDRLRPRAFSRPAHPEENEAPALRGLENAFIKQISFASPLFPRSTAE
jgi:hypothetical protein